MKSLARISRHNLTIGLVTALMIALVLALNLYERLETWIGYAATWSLDRFFLWGWETTRPCSSSSPRTRP